MEPKENFFRWLGVFLLAVYFHRTFCGIKICIIFFLLKTFQINWRKKYNKLMLKFEFHCLKNQTKRHILRTLAANWFSISIKLNVNNSIFLFYFAWSLSKSQRKRKINREIINFPIYLFCVQWSNDTSRCHELREWVICAVSR